MHDLKKVYEIIHNDSSIWYLDGRPIYVCTYLEKEDYRILILVFEGGDETKTFTSRYTHDIEDDDQYVGVGVCFYSPSYIEFRQWEDDAGKTVFYKLMKKI